MDMKIKAPAFKRIDGTIFVIVPRTGDVAQAVFKTVGVARKFLYEKNEMGCDLELRVGRFVSEDTIETI